MGAKTQAALRPLSRACEILGFGQLTGGGGPFRQPVLAQIIEPASELDSLRAGQRRGPAAVLSRAAAPRADLCYRGPAVMRNRLIWLPGGHKTVNRVLKASGYRW